MRGGGGTEGKEGVGLGKDFISLCTRSVNRTELLRCTEGREERGESKIREEWTFSNIRSEGGIGIWLANCVHTGWSDGAEIAKSLY